MASIFSSLIDFSFPRFHTSWNIKLTTHGGATATTPERGCLSDSRCRSEDNTSRGTPDHSEAMGESES